MDLCLSVCGYVYVEETLIYRRWKPQKKKVRSLLEDGGEFQRRTAKRIAGNVRRVYSVPRPARHRDDCPGGQRILREEWRGV